MLCADSSLLQKQEFQCYLSKLCILYANNYMVQTSALLSDKPSSVGEMKGRKFQGLDHMSFTLSSV